MLDQLMLVELAAIPILVHQFHMLEETAAI
jgi:hypothetical protein